MRSDEQMPGTVTRGPGARVAAQLGGRCSDLVWEACTATAADRRRAGHRPRGKPYLSQAHTPGLGPAEPGTGATQVRRPPVLAGRGSSATCQEEMRPRKGLADDAPAGVLGAVQGQADPNDLRLRRPHEMSSRSCGRRRPHTPRSGRAGPPDHEPNASRWWHREREEQSWLSLREGLRCRPCCMTWTRRRRRCG